MTRIIIAAALASLLAGCQTAQWGRPGATASQVEADLKICEYEANLALGPGRQTQLYRADIGSAIGAGIGDGISEALRIASLRKLCMEAKGYGTAA